MSGRLARALGLAISLGLLAWIGLRIASDWSAIEVWALLDRPVPLLISGALLLAAYLLRGLAYARILRGLDARVPTLIAMQVFFASQAGRYIPGKVWQVAGAGLLGQQRAGAGASAALASVVVVAVHHVVGAALALLALRAVRGAAGASAAALLVLLVGGAAALWLLRSPLFARLVRRMAERAGLELGGLRLPSTRLLLETLPLFIAVWLGFGLALWLVAGGNLPAPDAVGIMAAGCVAGYVVLVAPSGLGVREATLALLLAPKLGAAEAALVAVVLRLWMTVLEGVLITWGLFGARAAR